MNYRKDKYGNDLEGPDSMMMAVHEQTCFATLALSGKYWGLDCYGIVNINNNTTTNSSNNFHTALNHCFNETSK